MMIALFDFAQIERIRGLVGRQQPEAIDIEGPAAGKVADAELDMARAHDVERRIEDGRPYGHWLLCFFHPPADASRACPTCASIVAKPGQARVSWRGGSAACEANADGVGGLILLPVCGSPPPLTPSRHSLRSRGEGNSKSRRRLPGLHPVADIVAVNAEFGVDFLNLDRKGERGRGEDAFQVLGGGGEYRLGNHPAGLRRTSARDPDRDVDEAV